MKHVNGQNKSFKRQNELEQVRSFFYFDSELNFIGGTASEVPIDIQLMFITEAQM
jgi:hypothetical protein